MNIELIERPRARRRDPSTSHEAAKRADRFAQSHAGRILAAFRSGEFSTWTASELSCWTELTVVQIDRRLHEIPQIERTGTVVDGFTVWRLRHAEPCYFYEQGEADRTAHAAYVSKKR
jgi:hypothetical protein